VTKLKENNGRRHVLATACLGAFMATMDTGLINVALPQIAAAFGSQALSSWQIHDIFIILNQY
jgi:MFS family permease